MRTWLGVVASLLAVAACALTTDLDHLSSGGIQAAPEGGTDGGPLTDGGPSPANEGGLPDGGGVDAGLRYGEVVQADHPIAYFPFDEAPGARLVTEAISGKNASAPSVDFTTGVPGIAGKALGATGHADMDFGDTLDVLGRDPWTIEAWIKPSFEDGKVFYEYFNKRHDGNNGIVVYVRREHGDTTAQVEQSYGGGGRGVSGAIPNEDRFFHIVFVYDPDRTGIRVWVDGKRGDKGYDDSGGPTDNPQPVYIASGIRGVIDELAMYDYALPDARILAHFEAGRPAD